MRTERTGIITYQDATGVPTCEDTYSTGADRPQGTWYEVNTHVVHFHRADGTTARVPADRFLGWVQLPEARNDVG